MPFPSASTRGATASASAVSAPLTTAATAWRFRAAALLTAASGFAGLGEQIVWTQQGALWLGHEAAAVLAVVTGFFGGLAVGAGALGARIRRSARPAVWYAACEAAVAIWCVVLVWLMPAIGAELRAWIGEQPGAVRHWALAFGGIFVVLLPATAAMGATLPAMARVAAGLRPAAAGVAALYAANTAGAVAGVLASAFWLVPTWGLTRSALLCAALSLGCAAAALGVFARDGRPAVPAATARPDERQRRVLALLAATGLLGIGYEVLVVRVLSQVSEDTVYTYALLLAVYLAGTAIGAAAWRRLAAHVPADRLRDALLLASSACCLLGLASLYGAEALRDAAVARLGGGMAAALTGEAVAATVAFGPATVVMGALFAHLCGSAAAAGVGLGRAICANTLGAAAAPLVFGVVLLPAAGPKVALACVGGGYLTLGAGRTRLRFAPVALAATAAAAVAVAPSLAFVDVPDGGRIVSDRDGVSASVSVVEDADGVARLRIDNRQQEGSNASRLVDARQALLPLLLHPAPRRALFLGLGTGVTAAAATLEPGVEVDAVELLPEVIEASRHFTPPQPRLRLLAADARRYASSGGTRYDLVVADNFHPARSGSGALYTVEHFRAVRERLADGGVFCQWLPLHQLDLQTLRSIVRSFLAADPRAVAVVASNSLQTPVIGLLGARGELHLDPPALQRRIDAATAAWAEPPAAFGIDDAWALLGSVVAGPRALAAFAAGAELNTDDMPVVAYAAPHATYAPESSPADRLLALLQALPAGEAPVPAAAPRWAAYQAARRIYLDAGRRVRVTSDPAAMLAQVQAPLLAALAASSDFRPAYDPLLRLAMALAPRDPAAARRVLEALAAAVPSRTEAGRLLQDLP